MRTSNYAKSGAHPLAVAISRSSPKWFRGRIYPELYPPQDLLDNYKRGTISQEEYTRQYNSRVLATLDPYDVIDILGEDAILLCWEGQEKFCHRRLVAKWLETELSITVPEVAAKPRKAKPAHIRQVPPGQATLAII